MILLSLLSSTHSHSSSTIIFSERASAVLFCCLFNPPSFQALLSRGISELLVTSDNKDGLQLGGVKGGIVRQVDRQTSLCIHIHTYTHAHMRFTVSWLVCVVFIHNGESCEPRGAQCHATAVQKQAVDTDDPVLYWRLVLLLLHKYYGKRKICTRVLL